MRVGANESSDHARPRLTQTLGLPMAWAPAMSDSALSPTTQASATFPPALSAAASKMAADGLLAPTSAEMVTESTNADSPVAAILSS